MGRTVPSFRMLLEGIIEDLSVFKRALRGEDKVAFDSLMNRRGHMRHLVPLRHFLSHGCCVLIYIGWAGEGD
jgi:hypothetical protein